LNNYGEEYVLFDHYSTMQFNKILQIYFTLLNDIYSNVDINYRNHLAFGIKKINNKFSFRYSEHVYDLLTYCIYNVPNGVDVNDNMLDSIIKSDYNYKDTDLVIHNKISITTIKQLLYDLADKLFNEYHDIYLHDLAIIEELNELEDDSEIIIVLKHLFYQNKIEDLSIINNEYICKV
jgi:hypothetical protein